MSTTDVRIKLRRDTTDKWEQANPVLLKGEVGLEYDNNMKNVIGLKIGDGVTSWNDLDYFVGTQVPNNINFDNLVHRIKLSDTLTIQNEQLSLNVDQTTYAEDSVLTWNPDVNKFVYSKASSGAFKNLIMNGGFDIWQRGTSFNISGISSYTADRWSSSLFGVPGSKVSTCDLLNNSTGVLLYEFEGNANDTCGHYNGTWHGTEQYDTGKFGQAAKFNGSSYIKVTTDENLRIVGDLTVSTWVNWNGANSSTNDILTCASSGESLETNILYQVAVATDGHIFFFQEYGSGSNVGTDFTYKLTPNEWYHIAVVRDTAAKVLKLYINSNLVEQKSYSNTAQKASSGNTQYLCIAGNSAQSTPGNLFNGLIDQIRILNYKCSDADIFCIYNESKPQGSVQLTKGTSGGVIYEMINSPDYSEEKVKPLVYKFEGNQLYHPATKNAYVTLSFDFKSNKTGTYNVALINKTDLNNIQSYIKSFSYDTADTIKRFILPFDLTKFTTIVKDDTELGFELVFLGMSDDTDTQATEDKVVDGEKYTLPTTVRLDTNDQVWINRVQLEEGSAATEFKSQSPQIEHLLCRRYYQIKSDSSTLTLFPLMRVENPKVTGTGPYYFDAEL